MRIEKITFLVDFINERAKANIAENYPALLDQIKFINARANHGYKDMAPYDAINSGVAIAGNF